MGFTKILWCAQDRPYILQENLWLDEKHQKNKTENKKKTISGRLGDLN